MSQENVEVVRAAWSAFRDGGMDAVLAYYAEDCVAEDFPEMVDRDAVYKGWAGMRRRDQHFRESWGESGEEYEFRPLEFIDAGNDVVLVPIAMSLVGRGSGAPLETLMAFVYELRDGKIVRDRAFTSKAAALEAVGLRSGWMSWENREGRVKDGDYTLVEDQEAGPRGLAVRRVSEAERRMVWRWGGFLFATAEDAEQFARGQMQFRDGPHIARQAFSHKRVDGQRIYVHLGSVGG
jgi:ketosteroid isomerase-like protein